MSKDKDAPLDLEAIEARVKAIADRGSLEHGALGSRLHQLVNKDIPVLTREVRRLLAENASLTVEVGRLKEPPHDPR